MDLRQRGRATRSVVGDIKLSGRATRSVAEYVHLRGWATRFVAGYMNKNASFHSIIALHLILSLSVSVVLLICPSVVVFDLFALIWKHEMVVGIY